MPWLDRVKDVATVVSDVHSIDLQALLERLSRVSVRGLAEMFDLRSRSFPQTVRGHAGDLRPTAEGMSVRYTAIAALGLARMDPSTGREVLAGLDVTELLPGILSPHATIVTESDKRDPLTLAMRLIDERTYGDTRIAIHRGL